ncbi:helix-turn-helix domain-containing protein [Labrenzia sp. PHM005]|uniref:helix-turn-helix domain-containing protein n=1 Tax=Labrenzia sp. PHM005 TaxID=2590016 RepID=UPI00143D7735|nr:helix-turn-helix domain-containing protein [Labrenzia sp. PHM005]
MHRNTKDGGPPKRRGPRLSIIPSGAVFDKNLSATQFRVLGLLCYSTNRQGHTIRSQNKMAKELGLARSTVQRAVNNLEALGWLKRVNNRRPDGGCCSLGYIINYDDSPVASTAPPAGTSEVLKSHNGAIPAAPAAQGRPERCGHTKNVKSNNAVLKTDRVDKSVTMPGFSTLTQHPRAQPVMTANELRMKAQGASPYIEKVKQQLLFVGIHLEHSNLSDGLDTVLEWHDFGADVDLDIVPMLAKVMARCQEPPSSLKYFTRAIQNSVKRRLRKIQW